MCSMCLGRRLFASSAQAPLEEIVGPFVSPFAVVVSTVQLRQVSILVVVATTMVCWS